MPGPYDKFQEAFETFQTELREELHGELERLRQPLAATPQVTQEVPNLHDELAAFGEELVREVQTLLMQIPQEKPNPLAFYETILRVRSHSPRRHGRPVPKNPPYFADVFNDVVSYFGGRETTDPLGQRFITEAEKRFAYVKIPKTTDPVYRKRKRRLTLHDLAHQTFREVFNQDEDIFIVWDNPEIVLDFDERDFAVLRPVEHQRVEEDIIDGEKPVRIAKFNVIDHLLNVGHPNDAIATFVIKYLQFLKSETTVPLDPNNLGFSVLRTEQEELKEHLEYLNNMMYLSMRFQQIPAPDVLAKIAEDFADK